MATVQHETAKKLLPVIADAYKVGKTLTYKTAASLVGRNPNTNARAIAHICDLLDASAAFAGVPLLALVTVREESGEINRNAWTTERWWNRDAIIKCSQAHAFSERDFQKIEFARANLEGMGSKSAWKYVRGIVPDEELYKRLTESGYNSLSIDAIDDIGADGPLRQTVVSSGYIRDLKVRKAVLRRAGGKCEYCGAEGFLSVDGTKYLECHHIVALAKDGADRLTNVIALCANHHRQAHFGKNRMKLEKEMAEIVAGKYRN